MKKFISILLASVLVLSCVAVLASCGDSGKDPTDSANPTGGTAVAGGTMQPAENRRFSVSVMLILLKIPLPLQVKSIKLSLLRLITRQNRPQLPPPLRSSFPTE